MIKFAETSGTHLMPSAPHDTERRQVTKAVVNKTATVENHGEMPHLVSGHKGEDSDCLAPFDYPGNSGTQMDRLPQAHVLAPHVHTTSEPTTRRTEKKASLYALPGKYPLDSYAQVKAASGYFDEFWKHFSPADRHEFAVQLCKQATTLSIPVSDMARKYGSQQFAPEGELKVAFAARRQLITDPKIAQVLDSIEQVAGWVGQDGEKLAFGNAPVTPEFLVEVLSQFDKLAGLDHHYDSYVPDPYFSVYGRGKTAAFSETIGNQTVTDYDLEHLGHVGLDVIPTVFSEDLWKEFKKDPVGVYKSLPVPERKIIANMARQHQLSGPV